MDALAAELQDTKRELGRLMGIIEDGEQPKEMRDMIIGDKGKPPSFDGVKKLDFADWNFKLKAFIGNLNQKALRAMCLIEHAQETLKPENYTDGEQQLASSLYFQLTMYTEGTPLGIIRKVTNQDGFEAYRKLCYQYNPQTMGNTLARLMKILEFNFGADGDFLDKIASFEGMIEEYEKSAGEALSDNIRSAIMVAKSPEALRNHILLTVPKEQVKWPLLKKVAMDYFLACQSMTSGPQAMDVGAVWSDKGKGKSKGKHGRKGKGKGKDSEKGGKSGKKEERFQGHCGKCGRWGHKQQDCFARIHNVESWQEDIDATWPDAWQSSPDPPKPDACHWSWIDGGEPPSGTREEPAEVETNAIICMTPRAGEYARIFAVGTNSSGHCCSTGPGQVIDLMVDTGANRSACGPSHFPSFPIEEGQRRTISAADGSKLQYYGDKKVRLKIGEDNLEVRFCVTDVTQPILAVSSMNDAGATVEFPHDGSNRTASITRDSATGRRRLELERRCGSFFLRATVARAMDGKADLRAHAIPMADASQPTAQQVDKTMGLGEAPAWRPWSTDVDPEVLGDASWNPERFGEVRDGTDSENTGEGTEDGAIDKPWVCPCGCRPADEAALEIPHGRLRCRCRNCRWTPQCWRMAEQGEQLCAHCVGGLVPGGDRPPPSSLQNWMACWGSWWSLDGTQQLSRASARYFRGQTGRRSDGSPPRDSRNDDSVESASSNCEQTVAVIEGIEPNEEVEQMPGKEEFEKDDLRHTVQEEIDRHDRTYDKKAVPIGETVAWKEPEPTAAMFEAAWGYGTDCGMSIDDDSHLAGAPQGVITAKTIRRPVEGERYDRHLLISMRGTPADPKAAHVAAPALDQQEPPAAPVVAAQAQRALPGPLAPSALGPEAAERRPRPQGDQQRRDADGEGLEVQATKERGDEAEDGPTMKQEPPDQQPASGSATSVRAAPSPAEQPAQEGMMEVSTDEAHGKRAAETENAEDPAPKERWVNAVRMAVTEAMGHPSGTQWEVPCEFDPSVGLTHDAVQDEDDGEPPELDAVRESIMKEMRFMDKLRVEEAAPCLRGRRAWDAGRRHRRRACDFHACNPWREATRVLQAVALFPKHVTTTADFSVASMHTPPGDEHETHVENPLERDTGRGCGRRLRKALYGHREAIPRHQESPENLVMDPGPTICVTEPMISHHIEKGTRVAVHTDDPFASGPTELVNKSIYELAGHVASKGCCASEPEPIVHLGHILQELGSTTVERSRAEHTEGTLEAAGTKDCKSVSTPGARPELEQPGTEDHSPHRRLCGKTQHAVPRRPDAMYPLKEPGRRRSSPRGTDMRCLKHLPLQGSTDTEWADCRETRRPTVGGIIRWCGVIIACHARAESEPAQSSPEAGYLGAVALAAETSYIAEPIRPMGSRTQSEIERDVASAIAMAPRRRLGRGRHMELKWLRPQQMASTKKVKSARAHGTERCRTMLGMAAVGSMGTIVAAAWALTHRAQMFLAVWMMAVSGVKGQADEGVMTAAGVSGHCDDHGDDGRSLDTHSLATIAAAMMLGMIFGHMITRSSSIALPTASAPAGASDGVPPAASASASASTSVGMPAGAPETALSPIAPSPASPGARQRVKQVFHTDSRSAMVHVDSQCQQLRNRSNRLITRSVCSVCSGGLCLD